MSEQKDQSDDIENTEDQENTDAVTVSTDEDSNVNFGDGIATPSAQNDIDRISELLIEAKYLNDKLEVLMPSVLQTAETSAEAAEVSRQASSSLDSNSEKLGNKALMLAQANERQTLTSWRILSGSAGALLVALGLFAFMSFQLADRVVKVDAMIVAVSKRIVEMNSSLDELSDLNASITGVSADQRRFSEAQANYAESLQGLEQEVKDLSLSLPNTTANSVEEKTSQVVTKIDRLEASIASQKNAISSASGGIEKLEQKIRALEDKLQGVTKLNRSVTALVALEREDYIAVLREQAEAQKQRLAVEEGVIDDPKIVTFPKR